MITGSNGFVGGGGGEGEHSSHTNQQPMQHQQQSQEQSQQQFYGWGHMSTKGKITYCLLCQHIVFLNNSSRVTIFYDILFVSTGACASSTAAQSSTSGASIICQSPSSSNLSPVNSDNHGKTMSASSQSDNKSSNANPSDQRMSNEDRKCNEIKETSMKTTIGSRQTPLASNTAKNTSTTSNSSLVLEDNNGK